MDERQLALAKIVIEALLALVLIITMTWVILSPTSDEVTKGALVIISAATGYLFGKHT